MSEKEKCMAILDDMTQERISRAVVVLELLNSRKDVTLMIPVKSAVIGGIERDFNTTIYAALTAGEYFIMEYLPYNIYVTGDTLNEVRDEFNSALNFLYSEYALESDDALTDDAKELKAALLRDIG